MVSEVAVTWACCFGPVISHNFMTESTWQRSVHLMALGEKKEEEKGWVPNIPYTDTPTET